MPENACNERSLLTADSEEKRASPQFNSVVPGQKTPFEPVQETSLLTANPAEEMTFSHLDLTSGGQKTPSLMPLREAVFGVPQGVPYRAVLVGLFLVLVLLVGLVQAIVAFAIYRWIAGRVTKK